MLNELKEKLNNVKQEKAVYESYSGENSDIRDMFLDDTGASVSDEKDIETLIEKIPEFDADSVSDSELEKISEGYLPEIIGGE